MPAVKKAKPLVGALDLRNLRASGLTDETIRANELRTETNPAKLADILHWQDCSRLGGGLVFPFRNLNGAVNCYACVRPHQPRKGDKGKPIKYECPAGEPTRLYIPAGSIPKLKDSSAPVFPTEGAKKALALDQLGLASVGLWGTWNWKIKGSDELIDDLVAIGWTGRVVYIVFDHDPGLESQRDVAHACRRLAGALRKAGAKEVYRVELPLGADGSKMGVDDFLVAHGEAAFRELVRQAQPVHDLPEIRVTTREHVVNAQAVEALAGDIRIYQRGGALFHVIRAEKDETVYGVRRPAGAPKMVPLPEALLREWLASAARFTKCNAKEEWVPAHPPQWMVRAIHARGSWPGIRHLEAVVTVPVLRPDGTMLDTPGWDAQTGLLYLPLPDGCSVPAVPSKPSKDEVAAAVASLLDLVTDFPFEAPVHQAAWLAFLLTVLTRHGYNGPAPLTLFDGNVPGAGKGLLAAVVSIIATGLDLPVSPAHRNDEELRKSITAIAIAGDRLVILDNVTGVLGGPALEAALTSTRWRDRLLGFNTRVDLPLTATWAATGNNVIVGGDGTARRIMQVRLDSPEEHPEDRAGFKHPNLKAHVRKHRGRLLAAALTIVRGYCAAGRPDMKLRPWGSYEDWSALVRGAIVWAGLPDPGETRHEMRRVAEPEMDAVPALLEGIQRLDHDGRGLTVGEILEGVEGATEAVLVALRNALCILCPSRDGKVNPRSLGMKLHHLRGRVVGGRFLERIDSKAHKIGTRWRVGGAAGTAGGTKETRGTISKPPAEKAKVMKSPDGAGSSSPSSPSAPSSLNQVLKKAAHSPTKLKR